ncbi:hypothetical protein [Enterovibrio nigricans]|uniref:Uncharacterized protein n=1 Tax=Enterovibrio nigricans DSM 22720 TaxID=1121868 RepID=A0A1T4V5W7_9GAMM|nr:hypothetical protein [Enterovibrio nigricans]PKF49884.1 hypothetical protein AT251_15655 [Enterovibrio nigricans]SKA60306.1 hypothetical protein SAMN02745132_03275 [Enterovibrio nigricans DSM 22720]
MMRKQFIDVVFPDGAVICVPITANTKEEAEQKASDNYDKLHDAHLSRPLSAMIKMKGTKNKRGVPTGLYIRLPT